jgi:hypothetical protein
VKKILFFISFFCIGMLFIWYSHAEKQQQIKSLDLKVRSQKSSTTAAVKPDINFGKIPLYFISNQGQVNKKARFYAKASRYTLWITKEGLVFDSTKEVGGSRQELVGKDKLVKRINKSTNKPQYHRNVSRLMFVGANKHPEIVPLNLTKLKVNYFKGNDKSKWHCNIPTSMAVLYKNLYKNIDLKVYGIEKQIEYDWIVKPEGNLDDIRFEYKNVKKTRIDKEGNLVITTKFGELMHKKPISYNRAGVGADLCVCPSDEAKENREQVNVTFKKIKENTYGFKVWEYDKSRELIIDPVVLAYSTYLGGGGNDEGYSIAVDSSGYAYVTGNTTNSDFPCLNQHQTDQGGDDVFVTKLDPSQSGASSLLYSTYLGGGANDYGHGIAVYSSGHAYVTGYTSSMDFPCLNQYQTYKGADAFVTKLDPSQSGADSLLYSTYLGGGGTDFGEGIVVDSSGNAYVTGYTSSTDFPCLNQYQTYQGLDDAFVTKLDPSQSGTSSLLYSTYLGGGSLDYGTGIAVDSSGNAYVTGYTVSTDFPCLNQYQTDQGYDDAFVTKLDPSQSGSSSLLYSTYLGGGSLDYGTGIAVDSSGNAYVTGYTVSTGFPCLNQYQTYQGSYDAFVTMLDPSQSGANSLLYSTYLGGWNDDRGCDIAVDSSGNAYVTGYTFSPDFPCLNQYQTYQGSYDVFITKLDPYRSGASGLLYSTYLGGGSWDLGHGIAEDNSGKAYVTGATHSTDFPCLNQYQTDQGGDDVFVTMLIHHTAQHPLVLTKEVSSLGAISASCGGIVIAEGDSAVIARGVCWSTSLNPTIWDNYTIDGSGLGEYQSLINEVTPETTYYVRAYAANEDHLTYGGEKTFITLSPSVTVTSPNGGETWAQGGTENITWTSDLLPGELVKISLIKPNGVFLKKIADNFSADLGSHPVFIPASLPERDYRIKIEVKGLAAADASDSPFTVSSPSITLTSPIGGENWQAGTTRDITWHAILHPGDLIKIVLLKTNGKAILEIANNLDPTPGTFAWNIPSELPARDYLIKIKVKSKAIADVSDSAFSLY